MGPKTEQGLTRQLLNGWKGRKMEVWYLRKVKSLSCVRLFETPWTVAYQAPLFMGFSRQEYWSGLSFPSLGIFPTQGLNLGLPHCRQMLLPSEPPGKPSPYYLHSEWTCSLLSAPDFYISLISWNSLEILPYQCTKVYLILFMTA